MERVQLSKIRIDGGTQPRAQIDQDAVSDYAESLESLPPADVFFDGTEYWLADGFHRYYGHVKAGAKSMPCTVHKGTQRDAILFSIGANTGHGLRRTNADKVRAVRILLDDQEWSKLSERELAKLAGVSPAFVGNLRNPERAYRKRAKEKTRDSDSKTRSSGNVATEPETFYDDDKPDKETSTAPVETKDEAGQVIREEKVLAVYRRRSEITELMNAISKIKSTVNKAVDDKDPLFRFINVNQFMADCGNVHRSLRFSRPYATCPYCGERGCKVCKSGGWVNETTYKNYTPEDLKV